MSPAELAERLRLIVITDRASAAPRAVAHVVREALAAGAPAVQLRDKGASANSLYHSGLELLPIVRDAGGLFFVNDRLDVALALGADGVHVGPDDLPVVSLRAVVPPGFVIGTSTDDPQVATRLVADGADYIGCGTVYPTGTKRDAGEVIGLDGLDRVARAVPVPVVGVGGITPSRSAAIARTAATGVAVVSAVMGAADVGAAVRELLGPWKSGG